MELDAKTAKSELTRAAIVDAAIEVVLVEGLVDLSLQAVADRVGLSKSGVFSRVGSREMLQMAVIDEFARRFQVGVFAPSMELPKGLPRLNSLVQRWLGHLCSSKTNSGCIFIPGAFELDDREGQLRVLILREVLRWRSALKRAVIQSIEAGHLLADTDPDELVGDIYNLGLGALHDSRFLRDPKTRERVQSSWQRLLRGVSS